MTQLGLWDIPWSLIWAAFKPFGSARGTSKNRQWYKWHTRNTDCFWTMCRIITFFSFQELDANGSMYGRWMKVEHATKPQCEHGCSCWTNPESICVCMFKYVHYQHNRNWIAIYFKSLHVDQKESVCKSLGLGQQCSSFTRYSCHLSHDCWFHTNFTMGCTSIFGG